MLSYRWSPFPYWRDKGIFFSPIWLSLLCLLKSNLERSGEWASGSTVRFPMWALPSTLFGLQTPFYLPGPFKKLCAQTPLNISGSNGHVCHISHCAFSLLHSVCSRSSQWLFGPAGVESWNDMKSLGDDDGLISIQSCTRAREGEWNWNNQTQKYSIDPKGYYLYSTKRTIRHVHNNNNIPLVSCVCCDCSRASESGSFFSKRHGWTLV